MSACEGAITPTLPPTRDEGEDRAAFAADPGRTGSCAECDGGVVCGAAAALELLDVLICFAATSKGRILDELCRAAGVRSAAWNAVRESWLDMVDGDGTDATAAGAMPSLLLTLLALLKEMVDVCLPASGVPASEHSGQQPQPPIASGANALTAARVAETA